ncbi:MAG: hypothetical protein OXE84_12460 [Rhodobacteraceae bacterium]|nr:hypothetical protein [Paracoccaceae bacterium]MCY4326829.1 hypothetical protein [Paracoccaceae bacterium]
MSSYRDQGKMRGKPYSGNPTAPPESRPTPFGPWMSETLWFESSELVARTFVATLGKTSTTGRDIHVDASG